MHKISFEFIGGPNDGKIVSGAVGDGSEAERYYLFSQHGKVGTKIKVVSPYAVDYLTHDDSKKKTQPVQRHFYMVTNRYETDDEVVVRAEYT